MIAGVEDLRLTNEAPQAMTAIANFKLLFLFAPEIKCNFFLNFSILKKLIAKAK